jgi:hypothetical protein
MNARVRESLAIGLFALFCGWIAGLFGEDFFTGVFTVEALGAGLISIFLAANDRDTKLQ